MSRLPQLFFFDLPSRGEAIRLALHIGGVQFEDIRFSFDEWTSQYKKISPNGKAPWLVLDAYTYFESQPILLWASALTHLLPREATSLLAAKTLVDACDPLWHDLAFYYWKLNTDPEGYKSILPHLKQIETQLSRTQSSEGYAVSAGLSFADLVVAVIVWNLVTIPLLQAQFPQPSFPRMCRVYSLVMSHPAVLNYWKTTRHPMPIPLGPVSLDYYRNITVEADKELHEMSNQRLRAPQVPLLRRSESTPDGSDAVTLLLRLGDAEFQEDRTHEMHNRIELQVEDLLYTRYQGIVLWAATYANLMKDMTPEDILGANIVAYQCCEIFELHQQCAERNLALTSEAEKVEVPLQVMEKILQQSSMTANWSDICVAVVCALLKSAGYSDVQQTYPYIYLKKIQAPTMHPRIGAALNQLL